MNIQVDQQQKLNNIKPTNKGKVWYTLAGTLSLALIFTLGFAAYKSFFMQEAEISFVGTDACKVTFTIEDESLAPEISCLKLINGAYSTTFKPAYVELGKEFTYTLKVKNEGSVPAIVSKFEDTFASDNLGSFIQLISIVDSGGVICSINPGPPQSLDCTSPTTPLLPNQEYYVTVKAKALAQTGTEYVVNNLNVTASNLENDKTDSESCPAVLGIVETVYTKFSCTKEFENSSAAIGTEEQATIELKTSSTKDRSDIEVGEIIFDGTITSIDRLQVLDPLYNYEIFQNQNTSWLINPNILENYTYCQNRSASEGNEVFCQYNNFDIASTQNLVEFKSTISDQAQADKDIINVAALNITVGTNSQTVYCSDNIKVLEKEETDLECSKDFYDKKGNKLEDNKKVNAGEKILAKIEIKNKGNTNIDNIILKDPLDNTYKSKGAKNLNLLQYREISSNSSEQAIEKCKINEEKDEVGCSNISVSAGNSTTLYTLLKVDDAAGNEEIKNVAKVEFTLPDGTKVQEFCSDDFESKGSNPVHTECQNKACVEVEGEGNDECDTSAECSYTTCEGPSCTEKSCDNGNCVSSCTNNNDCTSGTQSHLECKDQACVTVLGAGKSTCSSNSDCSFEVQAVIPETGRFDYSLYLAISVLAFGLISSKYLFKKSRTR